MKTYSTVGLAVAGVLSAAGAAFAQEAGVRVEHAAARMVVIPERREDVSVTVSGGDARLPDLHLHREGDTMVVEGGLERRVAGCGVIGVAWGDGAGRRGERVMIRGIGPLTVDRLPLITAHVPLDAKVAVSDAVFGSVGATRSLSLADTGCGDWTIADVSGAMQVATNGSGDVHAGSAGSVSAAISGSGDLTLRRAGALHVSVAGSGDVRAADVEGPVGAQISGSGDVRIADGRSPNLSVRIAGSGDFTYGGTAGALAAQVAGSGDIRVAHVTGPVSKSVVGSGDVTVGR